MIILSNGCIEQAEVEHDHVRTLRRRLVDAFPRARAASITRSNSVATALRTAGGSAVRRR